MAYIYKHTRLDTNQTFYIGIGGLNKEDNYKRAYSKFDRNQYWRNIVKFTQIRVDIISDEWLTKDEACEKEKFWINYYGRLDLGTGSLCNYTDGGLGIYNPSEKHKQKIKISNKNRSISESQRDSQSFRLKGKSYVDLYGEDKANQIKEKQSKAERPEYKSGTDHHMHGKKRPEHSERMKYLYSIGEIKSISANLKGNLNPMKNPEIRKKVSDSKKGIPKAKIECPHCHKIGGTGNMERWHFNNCKKIFIT